MRILNAAQMREADRHTIEDIGIPSLVLMENAGRQVVAAIEAAYEERLNGRVAVLCGRGNNGGDGFVVARTLAQRGIEATVFLLGSVGDVRGDARTNLEILGRVGLTVVEITTAQEWELHLRGALRNGVSKDEIQAIIHHISIYAGVPVGVECFRAARKVFADIDAGA